MFGIWRKERDSSSFKFSRKKSGTIIRVAREIEIEKLLYTIKSFSFMFVIHICIQNLLGANFYGDSKVNSNSLDKFKFSLC